MKHIYEWLNEPPENEAEKDAKEWLEQFVKQPGQKDEKWLDKFIVTVTWRGDRYICSGASRMGDVWLKKADSVSFYDHRVNVEELSNWKRVRRKIS